MKKILYLFITVCFFSNLSAQTITFPDSNLKARLLLAQNGNGIAYHNGNSFKIDSNNDNEIQVSEALMVHNLVLYNCSISNLSGLENFINLTHLNCANNFISTLNVSPFPNLIGFDAYNNNLTNLTVSGLTNLTNFSCNNNPLTSLIVNNVNNLHSINCYQNQLTELNVSGLPNLVQLNCQNNQIVQLDLSNQSQLANLNCSNNNLTTLNIKNNSNESVYNLDFSNNLNLQYVCADEFQLPFIQNKITTYGYSNCFVNTYCSYVSGENFYSIIGTAKYDETNDGCDALDIAFPNLKLSFSNGTNTGNAIGNTTGDYNYTVQNGTHTVQPILNNPNYFNVSPSSAAITFPTQTSPYTQNFCITPNGLHPDLDINISQSNYDYTALPGANNTYKIVYKNKGTHTQSGAIQLNFNDAILNYSYSNTSVVNQTLNTLVWNFSNLKPFESREILVTLYLNSNTDFPSVNEGDLVTFTTSISTASVDETPTDNTFTLNQVASSILLSNNQSNNIETSFTLYPNPTSNILTIEAKASNKKETIKVYNISGQLVINITNAENVSTIDVSKLNVGSYFINIQTENGIYKSKFIKK